MQRQKESDIGSVNVPSAGAFQNGSSVAITRSWLGNTILHPRFNTKCEWYAPLANTIRGSGPFGRLIPGIDFLFSGRNDQLIFSLRFNCLADILFPSHSILASTWFPSLLFETITSSFHLLAYGLFRSLSRPLERFFLKVIYSLPRWTAR